ncbi:hypothetical protein [Amycolatopsis sp. YIM 10]|uniref:hypothetical protein n=1 Tax=Amycolatopsis sp. YIM 10 TaxID=2653857 RepID=UPI001290267B|nr:hypothetical protein [Amycolatopsis sp. YIM 10]QFU92083.1 hypothetical protein YIM_34610 [Amycolatopsis sp. YIM 10]
MNGDRRGGAVRRPRVIEQAPVPPGPLAELKKLVYELYLQAGAPSLDVITGWIAEDDALPGAPERDTIHRIIRDNALPPSQADVVTVVSVLSRAARWDPGDAAERARALWVAARMDPGVGVPLARVTDPFALEVHRPISLDEMGELPPLPVYARRAHDDRLAAVVARARAGESVMAVLVAGSSAGKTRACWEALQPLREAGGWRLWHPYDPTRHEAALRALDRVGPRTVVWLNETQEYLGGEDAERVAAKLRTLLADPARKPVLVLGTLWPEHFDALTRRPGSQVSQVLDGAVLEVPDAFTGADLTAMRAAADSDARLAWAVDHAECGQITQVLAGGSALLERFHTAPPAAKALLLAAMDARRLGHRNALSRAFLEHAAPEYLSDVHWGQLSSDWLAEALEYACRPCKGAPGPLMRTRSREPRYRLADYLDQYGRTLRRAVLPPDGFWRAATSTDLEDLTCLGLAAAHRGLYRDAAQCYKSARAVHQLLDLRDKLGFDDPRWLQWAIAHVPLDDIRAVEYLLVRSADHAAALLARDPAAHVPVDDLEAVCGLLSWLSGAGAAEQVTTLADRVVAWFPVGDHEGLEMLLEHLHQAGATRQEEELARRAADSVPMNDPQVVRRLLSLFQANDYIEQLSVLLARDPASRVPIDDPGAVADLLLLLNGPWPGATGQIATLLARDPAGHAALDDPWSAGDLLDRLHRVGAADQVAKLAGRAAAHLCLDRPPGLGQVLRRLRELGFVEQMTALAERAAALVPADVLLIELSEFDVAELLPQRVAEDCPVTDSYSAKRALRALHKAGATEQAAVLARRITEQVSLAGPGVLAGLLERLAQAGLSGEAATLLARDPAAHVALDDLERVGRLLVALRGSGADDQVAVLAQRIAAGTSLDDPKVLLRVLELLHEAAATEQIATLLDRGPAAHVLLGDWEAVWKLLVALNQLGAAEQVTALLARAVEHVPLDDAKAVLWLLANLPVEEAVALAVRGPAARVPLDDPEVVQQLLGQLAKIDAAEQVAVLLARDPASRVSLRYDFGVHRLWTRLRMLGANEQATSLAERLPPEGKFDPSVNTGHPFGREPDGTPAEPWGWDDLD